MGAARPYMERARAARHHTSLVFELVGTFAPSRKFFFLEEFPDAEAARAFLDREKNPELAEFDATVRPLLVPGRRPFWWWLARRIGTVDDRLLASAARSGWSLVDHTRFDQKPDATDVAAAVKKHETAIRAEPWISAMEIFQDLDDPRLFFEVSIWPSWPDYHEMASHRAESNQLALGPWRDRGGAMGQLWPEWNRHN
jgi:hypothetical protein